jgi:hypothetical protein
LIPCKLWRFLRPLLHMVPCSFLVRILHAWAAVVVASYVGQATAKAAKLVEWVLRVGLSGWCSGEISGPSTHVPP